MTCQRDMTHWWQKRAVHQDLLICAFFFFSIPSRVVLNVRRKKTNKKKKPMSLNGKKIRKAQRPNFAHYSTADSDVINHFSPCIHLWLHFPLIKIKTTAGASGLAYAYYGPDPAWESIINQTKKVRICKVRLSISFWYNLPEKCVPPQCRQRLLDCTSN